MKKLISVFIIALMALVVISIVGCQKTQENTVGEAFGAAKTSQQSTQCSKAEVGKTRCFTEGTTQLIQTCTKINLGGIGTAAKYVYNWQKTGKCQYGCTDGACNTAQLKCTDSDGGKNYNETGNVSVIGLAKGPILLGDECDNQFVLERYCSGNMNATERYKCPNGCVYGACNTTTQLKIKCTDSDGGTNFNVEGTVKIIEKDGSFSQVYDTCEQNNTVLMETVCVGGPIRITCPFICLSGRCVDENEIGSLPVMCTDSDGGKNYAQYGEIKYTLSKLQGSINYGPNGDFCLDDGKTLVEMSCLYNTDPVIDTQYVCPGACVNGICTE